MSLKFKHLWRIRDITILLGKYGFQDIIDCTALGCIIHNRLQLSLDKQDPSVAHFSRPVKIRMLVEEMGTTFIKAAQVLSNRPDLLPTDVLNELQKLQDHVRPVDFEVVQSILKQELNCPIEEVFEHIVSQPIGSASIGQVHRGKLLTGEEIVVKVQRPNIQKQIKTDLEILREFVRITEKFFQSQGLLNPMEIVEAFESSILKELDYSIELNYMVQFRQIYRKYQGFLIPKPYMEYSTDKLLIQEFIDGVKITDVDSITARGFIPENLAERGLKIYLDQIFSFGFFHADPHPGNVMINKQGQIALLDYGMIGRLNKRDKITFAGVVIGMANLNARMVSVNLYNLAIDHDINDMRVFEFDVAKMLEEIGAKDPANLQFVDIAQQLQKLIYKHHMQVPGSVFLVLRALVILEGIGKIIHPKLDTFSFVKPYGLKLIKEQLDPKYVFTEAMLSSKELLSLVMSFPYELQSLLKNLRLGKLKVAVDQNSDENHNKVVKHGYEKITLAILIVGFTFAGILSANTGKLNSLQITNMSTIFYSLSTIAGSYLTYLFYKKY